MAEWNSSTEYYVGNIVTYNGMTYRRSQFPPDPTYGTNPYDETSTDPKGETIRTWELLVDSGATETIPYMTGYYSLQAAARSDGIYTSMPEPVPLEYPGKLLPEHPYTGPINLQYSAYGMITHQGIVKEYLGTSVEWDQERAAVSPEVGPPVVVEVISAPVMPAEKCGVAMQQFQEVSTAVPNETSFSYASTGVTYYVNLTYNATLNAWVEDYSARPRKYYIFLLFNHPLFFRRSHTITIRTSVYDYQDSYTIPGDPPVFVPAVHTGTYFSEDVEIVPTDKNYVTGVNLNTATYIRPENAVHEYTLANDTISPGPYGSQTGTINEIVEIFVKNVESN